MDGMSSSSVQLWAMFQEKEEGSFKERKEGASFGDVGHHIQ